MIYEADPNLRQNHSLLRVFKGLTLILLNPCKPFPYGYLILRQSAYDSRTTISSQEECLEDFLAISRKS